MKIEPKIRGFICTTAHPKGCAQHVQEQVSYVREKANINGPSKVLIIGCSTGYGLASRIVASFSCNADTVGVCFEKAASGKRTASAGWYNTAAFEKLATQHGVQALTLNGDAFSHELKQQTVHTIKQHLGSVDLVIYSLASPKRVDPDTGQVYHSVLKTTGGTYCAKTVDPIRGTLSDVAVEPATEDEIEQTIQVMGGQDWQLWMKALAEGDVLSENCITVAYSYVGPELTYPIYRQGTIGKAKEDLEKTAAQLTEQLAPINGKAYVAVNKAVVTQASAAIPVVPLYMSILLQVMKELDCHEDCVQQIYRLFADCLYQGNTVPIDTAGRIRIDDWEMRKDVQQQVEKIWQLVDQENLLEHADLEEYQTRFYQLFGFEFPEIDYQQEVDVDVAIPSLEAVEA